MSLNIIKLREITRKFTNEYFESDDLIYGIRMSTKKYDHPVLIVNVHKDYNGPLRELKSYQGIDVEIKETGPAKQAWAWG